LGKSYDWVSRNVTQKEIRLWCAYWEYQHRERENIPHKPATQKELDQKMKGVARAFGVKGIKKRPKGT